jgi:lysozyme family protein
MADFTPAVEYVLANEGGYNPNDAGCPSNFGIRQASYPHLDIQNLTRDEAILIYQRDYWKFGDLSSQRLATKLLDVYVNEEHEGIKLLQQALGYLQAGPIVCDGIWGPLTLEHANAADPDALIDELKARLCAHLYTLFAWATNPSPTEWGLIRRAVKG